MRRPPCDMTRIRRDRLHETCELSDIGPEVDRRRSAALLIDLGPRKKPRRPADWKIQSDALDDGLFERAADITHRLLADRHAKRVAQMAHHLVRRHATPAASGIGTNSSQPLEDFGCIA